MCVTLRDGDDGAEEWMSSLKIIGNEWNYQEHDRWLKEQFINSMKDKAMTYEIIKELTTIKKQAR